MPRSRRPEAPLLERAYADLDLTAGALLTAMSTPKRDADSRVWRELGDWLLLADRVGAERVFFVNDDPVLVFATMQADASEEDVMSLYRRAWSLARPRCLFVAVGQELRVYALSRPPVGPGNGEETIEPLEVVRRSADVAEALARFHRERLESGAAFEDPELADGSGRADQQLLRDVRAATEALVASGLDTRVAHGLIERAILVRYLEDRRVLTPEYFDELAQDKASWRAALSDPGALLDFGKDSKFVRCLGDKALTYALFERLGREFNGDLFVPDADEQDIVTDRHLRLLRELLQGTAAAAQDPLFLWAYDFSVVPTSLVSTMYELFYHQEVDGRATSTYYTPPQLAEFVLADVLTEEVLAREPKICDPACGSGIFLVDAYRRIVRFEALRTMRRPSSARLRALLLERIAGCDIDESAVRLAAFSLYVAFLNYQSPQDIRCAGPLPRLIRRPGLDDAAPLIVGDAFSPSAADRAAPKPAVEPEAELPWPEGGFDVVVGNPPWTEPRSRAKALAERWAAARGLAVGDRSPSQLFLWRALDLLADEGVAALLVSAKAMFNTRTTAKAFRVQWLTQARVERVVNFSEVRRDFFEQGVAPFMLLRFRRADKADGPVVYESARPVARGRRGSPALARVDRRIVPQSALHARDYLWKTYTAGGHRDAALLARLELESSLRDLLPTEPNSQYGYQRARADERSSHPPGEEFDGLRSLAKFESWGPLRDEWFEPLPAFVKFAPDPRLYHGRRMLVRRGVASGFGPHARLESESLAFRHTTYAIPLGHRPAWQAKVALGTLLSSLGRYWLYMVSGSWGTWKDEIRAEELLDLPVRLVSGKDSATRRITAAVEALPDAAPPRADLTSVNGSDRHDLGSVFAALDEAVADLFELDGAERDLVADFWAGRARTRARPRRVATRGGELETRGLSAIDGRLRRYLDVFLEAWNKQLGEPGEFDARVWQDDRAGLIAVVFETRGPGEGSPEPGDPNEAESWAAALRRLGISLAERRGGSLLMHGIVRAVTDTAIVVIKRDEEGMWTATAAREDAEATTAQAIALERA